MHYTQQQKLRLDALIATVYDSPHSEFYRKIFGKKDFVTLEDIPLLTQKDLASSPLNERTYTKDHLFVKIVPSNEGAPMLIGRSRTDLKHENFGKMLTRPLVLSGSIYDALEKALWYYENGILPIVNEENNEVTKLAATFYAIDSITADLQSLYTFIESVPDDQLSQIQHVNIVDSSFQILNQDRSPLEVTYTTTLSLPEVGTIAHGCKETSPGAALVLHPDPSTIVEVVQSNTLVITRLEKLPTPLIRYQTCLRGHWVEKQCSCPEENTLVLDY